VAVEVPDSFFKLTKADIERLLRKKDDEPQLLTQALRDRQAADRRRDIAKACAPCCTASVCLILGADDHPRRVPGPADPTGGLCAARDGRRAGGLCAPAPGHA
jgi:hypothetical protein